MSIEYGNGDETDYDGESQLDESAEELKQGSTNGCFIGENIKTDFTIFDDRKGSVRVHVDREYRGDFSTIAAAVGEIVSCILERHPNS